MPETLFYKGAGTGVPVNFLKTPPGDCFWLLTDRC